MLIKIPEQQRGLSWAVALLAGLIACAQPAAAADFSSWKCRLPITFSGYEKAETLTNFPALVILSTQLVGFAYDDFAEPGSWHDLRFTAADQSTELNFEVDTWDTNGASYIWVQVPLLTGTNTTIHAFWGKSDQSQPAYTANGATWDPNIYANVYHLNEDGNPYQDSGPLAKHGSTTRDPAQIPGPIGHAQKFTGTFENRMLIACPSMEIDLSGPFTLAGWFRFSEWSAESVNNLRRIILLGPSSSQRFVFTSGYAGTAQANNFSLTILNSTVSASAYPTEAIYETNTWYYIVGTYDGASTIKVYVDGALPAQSSAEALAGGSNDNTLRMGCRDTNAGQYLGDLDEVRLLKVALSPDWIWAAWCNQGQNASFNSYGEVIRGAQIETLPPDNITTNAADFKAELLAQGEIATVTVFWGLSDGDTNAVDWDQAVIFPPCSESGPVSTNISLEPDTKYFYRYQVASAEVTNWGSGSCAFFTAPILAFAPVQLTQTVREGGADATDQLFRVLNGSWDYRLAFTLTNTESWFTFPPTSGSTNPAEHWITVSYTGSLARGVYSGQVTAVSEDPAAYWVTPPQTATMDVILTVEHPLPQLAVTPSELSWTLEEGAPISNGTLQVWNGSGNYTLCYTGEVTAGAAWLTLEDAIGTSTGETHSLTVQIDTEQLNWGTNQGVILLQGADGQYGDEAEDSPREIAVTVLVNPAPAPAWLEASQGTDNLHVELTWAAVPDITDYQIWRAEEDDILSAELIDTCSATSYNDSPAQTGHYYYYWVRSLNQYSKPGLWSAMARGYRALPAVPEVTASAGLFTNQVSISWQKLADDLSYEVWRNIYDSTETALKISEELTGTQFADTEAEVLQVYYYWVRARNEITAGLFGQSASGYRALLERPEGLSASAGLYRDQVRVSWQSVPGADKYELWRAMPAEAMTLLTETAALGYQDLSVRPGVTYEYWVRARSASGTSAFSEPDTGFADLGKVGLALSDLLFYPQSWRPGGHPYQASVRLGNSGPRSLSAPDTGLKIAFYLSASAVWEPSTLLPLGTLDYHLALPAGQAATIQLSHSALQGLRVPMDSRGRYYVYARVMPAPSSSLVLDPAATNNVTRAAAMIEIKPPLLGDYDGDSKADPALLDPTSGILVAFLSGNDYAPAAIHFPVADPTALLSARGDYDGDGQTDPAALDTTSGVMVIFLSGSGYAPAVARFPFTPSALQPASGDYDGDGQTDPAALDTTSGILVAFLSGNDYAPATIHFPVADPTALRPASGDYDGDGQTDPAALDTTSGVLMAFLSGSGYAPAAAHFPSADPSALHPAVGDYDGDGKDDPCVYDTANGLWLLRLSGNRYAFQSRALGGSGYQPLVGDYDGDGIADQAVFAESTGHWLVWSVGAGRLLWNIHWEAGWQPAN